MRYTTVLVEKDLSYISCQSDYHLTLNLEGKADRHRKERVKATASTASTCWVGEISTMSRRHILLPLVPNLSMLSLYKLFRAAGFVRFLMCTLPSAITSQEIGAVVAGMTPSNNQPPTTPSNPAFPQKRGETTGNLGQARPHEGWFQRRGTLATPKWRSACGVEDMIFNEVLLSTMSSSLYFLPFLSANSAAT